MEVVFRKALPQHIGQLVKLRIDFLNEVAGSSKDGLAISKSLENYYSDNLLLPELICLIADDNGTVVATATLVIYYIPPNFLNETGKRGYLMNVYTLPSYRRRGISKKMMQAILEEAASSGVNQIALHAMPDAVALYESLGFVPKGNEMVYGNHL